MSLMIKLSPELKTWIVHNLDRGCEPEQLIESMVGQKFDPSIARGVIGEFQKAKERGQRIEEDSLTLATPETAVDEDTTRLPLGSRILALDRSVEVLLRIKRPILAVLGGILSAEECHKVIELARPRLKPSTVVDPATGEDRIVEHRNSEGMFFRLEESPFIALLDRRISAVMNLPVSHGEGLQVLRYGPGTKSTPHFDFLTPSNETNRQSLARSGQRVSSLVMYLNDVPAGGETAFPQIGVTVSPRLGHGVYFEYCNSRGELDGASLHAGEPVTSGEKWALTKWMRQKPFVSQ